MALLLLPAPRHTSVHGHGHAGRNGLQNIVSCSCWPCAKAASGRWLDTPTGMGEPVPAGERRQWGWEPRAQRCHSFPVREVLSGLASAPAACVCSYILQGVDFVQVTERFGCDIGLYLNHRINNVYIFISLSRLCTDISELEALKVWYQWMKTQADQLESPWSSSMFF